jgi:hypothetical protein
MMFVYRFDLKEKKENKEIELQHKNIKKKKKNRYCKWKFSSLLHESKLKAPIHSWYLYLQKKDLLRPNL